MIPTPHRLISASKVSGAAVFDAEGRSIGHIEDVMIDKLSGQVVYALLGLGGFLGLGERFHPLPWDMLHYDLRQGGYILPLEKSELETAPAYEPEAMAGQDGDDLFRDPVFAYYAAFGAKPYWL